MGKDGTLPPDVRHDPAVSRHAALKLAHEVGKAFAHVTLALLDAPDRGAAALNLDCPGPSTSVRRRASAARVVHLFDSLNDDRERPIGVIAPLLAGLLKASLPLFRSEGLAQIGSEAAVCGTLTWRHHPGDLVRRFLRLLTPKPMGNRRGEHEHVAFDFLGYTFQPRRTKNRQGEFFVSFLPAISTKAAKAIRVTIRQWRMASTRNHQSLEDLARLVNPSVRGWMNYYGRFYRSKCLQILRRLNEALAAWARRKFKRLQRRKRASVHWLGRIARRDPTLFVLWTLGAQPEAGS